MSISHQIFVVSSDDSIEKISQKTFNDFSTKKLPVLKKYGGQEIHVAMAFYELVDRKPDHVFRIDNLKMSVNSDGSINEERNTDMLVTAMEHAFPEEYSKGSESGSTIVNASQQFNKKRHDQYHPELSGPAHKRILDSIFGK